MIPKAWQEIGQARWVRCSSSVNFYDLQIETKVSLSLRNFVVALSVCVCVCVLSSTQVLQHTDFLLFFELSKKKTRKAINFPSEWQCFHGTDS